VPIGCLTIRAVSLDYAQAVLMQQNITTIRRVRKSDNNRIARAVGATIVNRVEDLREADVGTSCGLFHVEKLGDEWVPPLSPWFPRLHVRLLIKFPPGTRCLI
jgi:chaperonin GroEL (HSP60 family)